MAISECTWHPGADALKSSPVAQFTAFARQRGAGATDFSSLHSWSVTCLGAFWGAVFSSCAPDSGPDVVINRFRQIEPKLLFAVDGYFYSGKTFDTRPAIAEVARRIPSIEQVVFWPNAGPATDLPDGMTAYDDLKQAKVPDLACEPMGFRDPLFIMFSSGTTGKPKYIEHSGGGTLLRLLVEHQLHCDIRPGDTLFYYTTCSWIKRNCQVAALASGAAIVSFDGNPMFPGMARLFDSVDAEDVTHFGISAKYIDTLLRRRIRPAEGHGLSDLRVVLSTGSPLSPHRFDAVYRDWKADVQLSSICGGTDILGCFIGDCPLLPVHKSEIQPPILGLDVTTLDRTGAPVTGTPGELVCRNAHPSKPIRFLGDPDNLRYRASYFDTYPNIWRQGDFTIRTETGGFVVLGRSDTTFNPGGVRIGTAEIHPPLDQIDAVVAGLKTNNDVEVILFVVLDDGMTFDADLKARIREDIRKNASPRHMPRHIIAGLDIPRSKSGKITELAVRDAINACPVRDLSGLANPDALAHFIHIPELSN